MMAVNVYHACIVGIFTTRLRRLFVCGPRRAKNNSSCAAFRCAMACERDRAPQIRTTGVSTLGGGVLGCGVIPAACLSLDGGEVGWLTPARWFLLIEVPISVMTW